MRVGDYVVHVKILALNEVSTKIDDLEFDLHGRRMKVRPVLVRVDKIRTIFAFDSMSLSKNNVSTSGLQRY